MRKMFSVFLILLLVIGIAVVGSGCREISGDYNNSVAGIASSGDGGEIQEVTLEWKSVSSSNYSTFFCFHFRTKEGKELFCEVGEKDYYIKFPGDKIRVMIWKNFLDKPQFQG